ncbi:hypothetical protein ONZ51_g7928 [Trametes cubensis]|uniref:YDG domain-containing protein n=1 Tax=Trametes cubensis TaxID=1111947 RepID=A0AAD7X6Z6_9APHY|nr:hypothetical protein ONZ51_g7928 [Trametes cubensis]
MPYKSPSTFSTLALNSLGKSLGIYQEYLYSRRLRIGIGGDRYQGCYCVALSGGYEDDIDKGYTFMYTGCGGRDKEDGEKPREGPQTCDQSWDHPDNMALKVSSQTKKPVRVVRGHRLRSEFAPVRGYRYDGLYVVESAWMDVGKSGFQVCRFLLKVCNLARLYTSAHVSPQALIQRLPGQPPLPRRHETLRLDLSQWERPIHFGNDRGPYAEPTSRYNAESCSESDSGSESESDEERRVFRRREYRRATPMATRNVPLIRRPRDYYGAEVSSRRRSASPPPRRQRQPSPIPPTTNIQAAERRLGAQLPSAPPQASAQAPQVDVLALAAEMKRSRYGYAG